MQMRNKATTILLVMALLIGLFPMASLSDASGFGLLTLKAHAETLSGFYGAEGDNVTWLLNTETGVLTISGTGAMKNCFVISDSMPIPWYPYRSAVKTIIIDNDVTSIGKAAFYNCTSLTDVRIGDCVTSIGWCAFENCTSLTNVTIGKNVIRIEGDSFSRCTMLESVIIGDSVRRIEQDSFYGCSNLSTFIVDENNTTYCSDEKGVLYNKDKTILIQYPIGNPRTSFTIPDRVTSIGTAAFEFCHSLSSVTIPNSVTTIGDCAFTDCTSLTGLIFPNSVVDIGFQAFSYCSSLVRITIPDSVKNLGAYAFYGCAKLENVTIGSEVVSVDACTFFDCHSLTNVTIGKSVIDIGYAAFSGCTSLSAFLVDQNNSVYSSDDSGVLYSKDATMLIQYPIGNRRTAFSIPDGVTSICSQAFQDCQNLVSLQIPEGVTAVLSNTFMHSEKLKSVTFPSTLTRIESRAFDSTGLIEVEIPVGVTSLGYYAFSGSKLSKIVLPDSLTYIGRWCFDGTPYYENQENWDNGSLYIGNHLIRVDAESISETYTIRNNTRSIACDAFSLCSKLKRIIIPNSAHGIGEYAFYGCSGLEKVQVPNSVKEIYYGAFEACTGLRSITISDRVKVLHALCKDCFRLEKVEIPASVTSIAYTSFAGCKALKEITLPATLKEIGAAAFDECSDLQNIYYKGNEATWDTVEINRDTIYYNRYSKTGNNDALLNAQVNYPVSMQQNGVIVNYFTEDLQNIQLVVDPLASDESDEALFQINSGEAVMKYDIHFVDANSRQPVQPKNHTVTVRIPIDRKMAEDYPPDNFVYRVCHAVNGNFNSLESFRTDGMGISKALRIEGNERDGYYLVFDVNSFSPFLVCVENNSPTVSIRNNPVTATLRYGDTLILTTDAENLPDGANLVWEADNDRVTLKPSADGTTCEVISKKNGTVTVTVKIVDASGSPIEADGKGISDSETIRSKATFFYKLIAFFKRLFGIYVKTTQAIPTWKSET